MRAFVAADVISVTAISGLQKELASAAGWSSAKVRPVEQQNLHFTLLFLGEVSDSDIPAISQALSDIRFNSFPLRYSSIGAFPNPKEARIIWVGVDKNGGEQLTSLATLVASRLSVLGFRQDKPFSPHLTIFRVKGRRPMNLEPYTRKYDGVQVGQDTIDKVQLKKSELLPSGPKYSNVYTVEAEK